MKNQHTHDRQIDRQTDRKRKIKRERENHENFSRIAAYYFLLSFQVDDQRAKQVNGSFPR